MYDFIGIGIIVALALFFGVLTWRAWQAQRLWVKLLGGIPTTLLTVIFTAALVLVFVGYAKVNRTYPNPVPDIQVSMAPERIAYGEKFARTCTGCHSPNGNFPLAGQDFGADGPPLGTFWASNLTQTHFKDWSDGEIIRAIREGIGKDGRSLMIMPSDAFRNLSDDDVQALVAYLRAQPPAEPDTPPRQINVIGALLLATVIPDAIFTAQAPLTARVIAPPIGRTAEYGNYLIHLGCQHCHSQDFAGIPAGGDSPLSGPSLVAYAQRTSEEEFVQTLRTGIRPDGSALSDAMPWRDLDKLSDDDFGAIYLYLRTLN
jgi:mono/diheme cytochrome c family protein